MLKKYNFFQTLDGYFRELAKVFLEIKKEGDASFADRYERVLNSTFYLTSSTPKTYFESMDFTYKNVKLEVNV